MKKDDSRTAFRCGLDRTSEVLSRRTSVAVDVTIILGRKNWI